MARKPLQAGLESAARLRSGLATSTDGPGSPNSPAWSLGNSDRVVIDGRGSAFAAPGQFSRSVAAGSAMHDLIQLNRRIARYSLGELDASQEAYLCYASACVARLARDASAFTAFLSAPAPKHENTPAVAELNRAYLNFARFAAKDVADGKLEMLLRLAITLREADILAALTNDEVQRIALGWPGLVIRFQSAALTHGLALHAAAARHHATAFITIGA
jgi:hypothetical protein